MEAAETILILTCESQAVVSAKTGLQQMPWMMSKLAIPGGTPRHSAERMVAHWLAFYGDDALATEGMSAFRQVFSALNEASRSEEPSDGQPQGSGTLN